MSPEGECKASVDSSTSENSTRWQNQSGKESSQNIRKILSPSSEASSTRSKRSRSRKESTHYQESDILESPQIYCRSNLGDKISDYEDLWTQENSGINTVVNKSSLLSSFRPDKTPDLVPEFRKFKNV